MVILALPCGVVAVSRLSPLLRPVTKPWYLPLGRTANMLLIGAPLSATLTPNAGFTAGGRLICTNASPPEIRSARFESTRISGPAPTADVDNEQASTAAGNNKRHIELIVHFILSP